MPHTGLAIRIVNASRGHSTVRRCSGALTRGDLVLHAVNYKSGHRGYVAVLLYQAGIKPPVLDIPVFIRESLNVP